jgi:hypothetical protein
MKKHVNYRNHHPVVNLHKTGLRSTINWTPVAALLLTGLICYILYTLFSSIQVLDHTHSGIWQLFG